MGPAAAFLWYSLEKLVLDPERSNVLLGEYALGDDPEDMLEGEGGPWVLPGVD